MSEIRAFRVERGFEPSTADDLRDGIYCLCGHDYETAEHATVKGKLCPSCGERAKVSIIAVVDSSEPPVRPDGTGAPDLGGAVDDQQLAGLLFYSRVLARSLQDESDRWHLNIGVRSYIAATWRVVSTIRQILRLAEKIIDLLRSSRIRQHLNELLTAHPDLKNLRDGLEHWDEYLAGTGNVQRQRGVDDPWLFEHLALGGGDWSQLEATFGPYTVGIADAARRAYDLALACSRTTTTVLRLSTEVDVNEPDPALTGAFASDSVQVTPGPRPADVAADVASSASDP